MTVTKIGSLNQRRDVHSVIAPDVPRRGGLLQVGSRVANRPPMSLWLLMVADLATAIWMYTVGPWLDVTSRFTRTATLGGHHVVLLIVALTGFLMLAALAVLTDNFTRTTPKLALARNLACIISIIALTGLIALMLMAILSRLLFGPLRP